MQDNKAQHYVYGREKGESGTPHLQGHVYFKHAKTLKSVVKILPGCHVSITRMLQEAIAYCRKDGDVVEWGTAPADQEKKGEGGPKGAKDGAKGGKMEKDLWTVALQHCKAGEWEKVPPRITITHYGNLKQIHGDAVSLLCRSFDHDNRVFYWFWGPAGAGKSRTARDMCGQFVGTRLFSKNASSGKWFNGMEKGMALILLEDVHPEQGKDLSTQLKLWCDRYPFTAEWKGGAQKINFAGGFVTSNYALGQVIANSEDFAAIKRRVVQVWFGKKLDTPEEAIHFESLPSHHPYIVALATKGEEATYAPDEVRNPIAVTVAGEDEGEDPYLSQLEEDLLGEEDEDE